MLSLRDEAVVVPLDCRDSVEAVGFDRFGKRLKTSWSSPRMAWFTGRSPSRTRCRYWPMSRSRRWRPWRDWSWDVIRVDRVPTATSRMSRRRCSTPISSASSASIVEGVCTKVLVVVVPSWGLESVFQL